MKKKLVVLSGAGISAESGLKTFRGGDGLWENHRVEDVATPEAWKANPKLVLEFYNQRRVQMNQAQPNAAHLSLAELESYFDVHVITQNVDNLHERAGSTHVLHLHGELSKSRSEFFTDLVYDIEGDLLNWGEKCERGTQLRPNIVWFGELVPMIEPAAEIVSEADILLIIGTSLQVYPAAGLVRFASEESIKFLIDPEGVEIGGISNLTVINKKAGEGLPALKNILIEKFA
jgi:NAD-dependent deacetylase